MRERSRNSSLFRFATRAIVPLAAMLAAPMLWSQSSTAENGEPPDAGTNTKAACSNSKKIKFKMRGGPVVITAASGAVIFETGMAVDADGAPNAYAPHNRGLDRLENARRGHHWVGIATDQHGHPFVQKRGRYRGYYVSTTSLENAEIHDPANPHKYVNATKIPYIVLPPEVAERFDISLGDMAVVINKRNGRSSFAIFADTGPSHQIGEGSIALAKALGLPSDPRIDTTEGGLLYMVFPGSGLGPGKLRTRDEINEETAALYESWGGKEQLQICSLLPRPSGGYEESILGSQTLTPAPPAENIASNKPAAPVSPPRRASLIPSRKS